MRGAVFKVPRARVLWLVRVMLLLTSKSMFRRDAVAGHAAVPRGLCALGQRALA